MSNTIYGGLFVSDKFNASLPWYYYNERFNLIIKVMPPISGDIFSVNDQIATYTIEVTYRRHMHKKKARRQVDQWRNKLIETGVSFISKDLSITINNLDVDRLIDYCHDMFLIEINEYCSDIMKVEERNKELIKYLNGIENSYSTIRNYFLCGTSSRDEAISAVQRLSHESSIYNKEMLLKEFYKRYRVDKLETRMAISEFLSLYY